MDGMLSKISMTTGEIGDIYWKTVRPNQGKSWCV